LKLRQKRYPTRKLTGKYQIAKFMGAKLPLASSPNAHVKRQRRDTISVRQKWVGLVHWQGICGRYWSQHKHWASKRKSKCAVVSLLRKNIKSGGETLSGLLQNEFSTNIARTCFKATEVEERTFFVVWRGRPVLTGLTLVTAKTLRPQSISFENRDGRRKRFWCILMVVLLRGSSYFETVSVSLRTPLKTLSVKRKSGNGAKLGSLKSRLEATTPRVSFGVGRNNRSRNVNLVSRKSRVLLLLTYLSSTTLRKEQNELKGNTHKRLR